MTPLQLRLEFVVEQGARTSLFGTDLETGRQNALHLDPRPWAKICPELRARSPAPAVYMAEGLVLQLSFALVAEERAA